MTPSIINKIELTGGENSCHRKAPILFPGPLGKLTVVHQPCLREKCTLWDDVNNQCRDVTTALSCAHIARTLGKLEDHLPPELP